MSSTTRRGSSISMKDENLSTNVHFKWDSIKKFIFIAFAFSTTTNTFDLFVRAEDGVRIFDYMLLQITVGMTYLCMDFFIKQYTRKIDFMSYLNPLLRGIIFGSVLQSSMLALCHSVDLADIISYLIASFGRPPGWSVCANKRLGKTCITIEDIEEKCPKAKTNITDSSIFKYYQDTFVQTDRATATSRTFISAIVWMANFFCSTLSDAILVKMMRISFIWSTFCTFMFFCFLVIYSPHRRYTALIGILNITAPTTFVKSLDHVTISYAVGLIGIHDYSSMSPYTMIDNTVVIFTILHTIHTIQRALVNRILILGMANCINFENNHLNPHYLLFLVTPLSMHFLPMENFHIINFYLTMMIQSGTNVAMITVTIARMLHNEFYSIRIVYIVGLLCAVGFILSMPMSMSVLTLNDFLGIMYGLSTSTLFLGFYKVSLIMYIYGVKKFSTDIHFWLGFKPTKFWTLNWMLTPIVLFIFFIKKIMIIKTMMPIQTRYVCISWIGFTMFVVLGLNAKILIKYLQKNNVMGIFRAHPKYGPLDRDILKKRKVYNETLKHKVCKHNCIVYDETYTECEHARVLGHHNSEITCLNTISSSILSIDQTYYGKKL